MPNIHKTLPRSEGPLTPQQHSENDSQGTESIHPSSGNVSVRNKRPRLENYPTSEDGSDDNSGHTDPITNKDLIDTIRREIETSISAQMKISLKDYFSHEFEGIKESLQLLHELEKSVKFMSKKFDEVKQECELN